MAISAHVRPIEGDRDERESGIPPEELIHHDVVRFDPWAYEPSDTGHERGELQVINANTDNPFQISPGNL